MSESRHLLPLEIKRFRPGQVPYDTISAGVAEDGSKVRLTDDARNLPLLYRGKSGYGKSYMMAGNIMEDSIRGAGVLLIDPTGSVYRQVEQMVASGLRVLEQQVRCGQRPQSDVDAYAEHFLFADFGLAPGEFPFCLNPLHVDWKKPLETPERVGGSFIKTIERRQGGDLKNTLRLYGNLQWTTNLLACAGGNPLDIPRVLRMEEAELYRFVERAEANAKAHGGYLPDFVREDVLRGGYSVLVLGCLT